MREDGLLVVHEAFFFLSATAKHKTPACTRFFIRKIVDYYRSVGGTDLGGLYLDTGNCACQYKCSSAVATLSAIGEDTGQDIFLKP